MRKLISSYLCSSSAVVATVVAAFAVTPAAAQSADSIAAPSDIVVTGTRKRAEDVQSVPVAITALSNDDLASKNISNLADLSNVTPGVAITSISGGTLQSIYLRGLAPGNTANDLNVDANVGVFIDGVYQTSRNTLDIISVLDVGQIEIAKGPQSALFGRSTFAGAMAISTRGPAREFEGNVSVTAGTDKDYRIRGSLSAPLGDTLSLRLSGGYLTYDGYGKNIANPDDKLGGTEKYAFTGSLLFQPTDNFSAKLSGFMSRSVTEVSPLSVLDLNAFNCGTVNEASGLNTLYCGSLPVKRTSDVSTYIPSAVAKARQIALELDWTLDGVKIVSVTGYTGAENAASNDYDGSSGGTIFGVCELGMGCAPFSFTGSPYTRLVNANLTLRSFERVRTFSQELRLQSEGNAAFQWMFGGNYFNSRIPLTSSAVSTYAPGVDFANGDRLVQVSQFNPATSGVGAYDFTANPYLSATPNGLTAASYSDTSTQTMSIFASAGYRFGDLRLTAEGRYNIDRKRAQVFSVNNPMVQPGLNPSITAPKVPEAGAFPVSSMPYAATYTAFTPRFTVDYQAAPDMFLYASAAKGVRSGGFNTANPVNSTGILASEVSYGQEFNWTYEAGFKSRLFDRRLLLNASVFHVDWTDGQIVAFTENPTATSPVRIVRNAGNIKATGIELESELTLSDMLSVGGSMIYSDTKFQKGAYDGSTATQCVLSNGTAAPGCQIMEITYANGTTALVSSLEGKRPQRSVKLQWNVHATADVPINDRWNLTGRVDVSYTGPTYVNQINTASFGERTLTNLRVGLESDQYSVSVWANNLFNVGYVANSIGQPRAGIPFAFSMPEIYLGETRRIGVTAATRF